MPAHARHMTTPKLIDAQLGPGVPQSTQLSFPATAATVASTDFGAPGLEGWDEAAAPHPRRAAVAFCITPIHRYISSCDCACDGGERSEGQRAAYRQAARHQRNTLIRLIPQPSIPHVCAHSAALNTQRLPSSRSPAWSGWDQWAGAPHLQQQRLTWGDDLKSEEERQRARLPHRRCDERERERLSLPSRARRLLSSQRGRTAGCRLGTTRSQGIVIRVMRSQANMT
jgi:hypothetical protein